MRPFAQRFVRRLPHGIVALVVTLTGCGMGTPDPASDNVRTKAAAAAETLAGFTAGLKSGETVLAEFRADYCLEGIHNRLMSGGEITPEDVARLTSAEGALMLLSARLRYHRA